jgi:hypothetical protein
MIKLDDKRRLAWIASYPRSGNTWLRSFLFSLYHVFRDASFESLDFHRVNEFCPWDNSAILFRKYISGPPSSVDNKRIAELRPRVFADVARQAKGFVLLKTHNARLASHGTPLIEDSVTAGAIYLVRNPLDVAVSFARFRNIPLDRAIADMASKGFGRMSDAYSVYWASSSWSVNVQSWTEPRDPRILVVRYEDLVSEPNRIFTTIANHLLMKPTDEQVTKALDVTAFAKMRDLEEAGKAKLNNPVDVEFFRSGKAQQWRDVLTKDQVDRIVTDHGAVMDRFGYAP